MLCYKTTPPPTTSKMSIKLLLLTTLLTVVYGQKPSLQNDIISTGKEIIYYIHKDSTKETKWTVHAVIRDIMDSIRSVKSGVAITPCEVNLKGYLIKMFFAIKELEGKKTLDAIFNMIAKLLEDGNYLLSGSLQLTGQAVQEVVGILLSVVVNTLNSIDVFESISLYLIEVYKVNLKVIHRVSSLLLLNRNE